MNGDGWDDLYVRTGHVPAYWFIGNPSEQPDLPYILAPMVRRPCLPRSPLKQWKWGEGAWRQTSRAMASDLLLGATDDGVAFLKGATPDTGIWLKLTPTVSAPGARCQRTGLLLVHQGG